MIHTVAVIGAGAVGSFFLSGLTANRQEAEDGEMMPQVFAVASGARKEQLEREGLLLNGSRLSVAVRTPQESRGADLIIICVKYGALQGVLKDLDVIDDGHAILLCPMNGVDTEEILAQHRGKKHLLHSLMFIAAERKDNQIIYNEGTVPCMHYGRVEGFADQEDLAAVKELFARTGLNARYSRNIMISIWNKFALNISTNIAQAVIGTNHGSYKTSPYMHALGLKLSEEVLEIARAKGISCTFDFDHYLQTMGTSEEARFSTLQDLTAGRHTEVDLFCGAVMRMGKECAVETPFNEFAYLAIKALEEKNDGLIH